MGSGSVGSNSGRLVEVVGEGFLGDLVCFRPAGPHGELGLGRSPGGMEERGRGGLTDVGEDLCDGLGIGEERDEREGRLAGGTDEGEDLSRSGPGGRPIWRVGKGWCPVVGVLGPLGWGGEAAGVAGRGRLGPGA